MTRGIALLISLAIFAATATAQELDATKIFLGPVTLSSGGGSPEGVIAAPPGSAFYSTTGTLYFKASGTGTTGWTTGGGLSGSGTAGTLAMWTGPAALGNSPITFNGEIVTVNALALHITGDTTIDGLLNVSQLRAKTFVAEQDNVLAGIQRVTKSYGLVSQAFTCPASGATATLWVRDAAGYSNAPVFQTNDWLTIRVLTRTTVGPFTVADCVGSVVGYADGTGANDGQQSWTFTRGIGAAGGAMASGVAVAVNTLAMDLGVSGNGYLEFNAVNGTNSQNAPYMDVVNWTGSPATGATTQCRYGNLYAITNVAEYGMFCGTPGTRYLRASNVNLDLGNVALTMYDGSTPTMKLDPTVPSFALGNPLPTSYGGANAGIWMGKDAGVYKLRIGGATGNRLQWDGATLSVAGEGSGVTNINGGNIQTNSVTVGQINATGFGDNVIKNGTFEGPTSTAQLAGWSQDANTAGYIAGTCCGSKGPGAMVVTGQTSGTYNSAVYFAVPVTAGQTYRIQVDIYAGATAPSGLYIRLNESSSTSTFIRYVRRVPSTAPDVIFDTYTDVCANCAVTGTIYTRREFIYTVPANVRWVSLDLFNYTCVVSGCQDLYFDAIDMSLQIGPGSILAGSITADRLAANSITAGQIAAGTITSTQIAAGTITAGNIAASTITSGQIAASTITGGNIAAGTITGGNIAAGTITADRLSVSTLSAITAQLGAVTAGTISSSTVNSTTITGSTITGSDVSAGCAHMNSNGITLDAGSGLCNWYKFSNGNGMWSDGGAWLTLQSNAVNLKSNDSGGSIAVAGNGATLQGSGNGSYFVQMNSNGEVYLGSYSTTGPGRGGATLCVNTQGLVYAHAGAC